MNVSGAQRQLLALCAIRLEEKSVDWSLIARQAQLDRGLDTLYSGEVAEDSDAAEQSRKVLAVGLPQLNDAIERVNTELAAAESVGAKLTTVLDDDYPANLRMIFDLPPFLFYRGKLQHVEDALSVCVVGTREASEQGLDKARRMAQLLTERDVTVISGLARGIDTAGHEATLGAGGRTVAVIGTGITKCYPPENASLVERIVDQGAVVSQFWPTSGPTRWNFPRRNGVMSGISQGTVVIEASSSSGAKIQAKLALQHGKRVFLVSSLVTAQPWARNFIKKGATEVSSVEDVMRNLASADQILQASEQRSQLTLEFL